MSDLKPLHLSVKRREWREAGDAFLDGTHWRNLRGRILARDQYRCAFCGFGSVKYQEIHHLDDDHNNNDLANLVTACPLCHSCAHIGKAGLDRAAVLVICPQLSQVTINRLTRLLYTVAVLAGKKPDISLLPRIERIAQWIANDDFGVIERFGSTDPADLASDLVCMDDEEFERTQKTLRRDVRLFHLPARKTRDGVDRYAGMWEWYTSPKGPLYHVYEDPRTLTWIEWVESNLPQNAIKAPRASLWARLWQRLSL
jgi:intracellular multiplication protein IcmJ